MANLKWIKLAADIFDDEKILLIEARPDADSILIIWVKLLALAGKTNNSGVFLISKGRPYTAEMLATIFRRSVEAVKTALECFESFGMIEYMDGVVTIPNWEKHQNIDELERIREQTRQRVQRHRERQKELLNGSVTSNVTEAVTVTLCNAIDKNREEENKTIIEIVAHLNHVCGTHYKESTKKTQQLIRARLAEGFTPDDFKRVIDTKAAEWMASDMKKYLRPQTLFGTNFEAYLNQNSISSGELRKVTSHEEIEAMIRAEGAV